MITMVRTCGRTALIARRVSIPLIPGMRISQTSTSETSPSQSSTTTTIVGGGNVEARIPQRHAQTAQYEIVIIDEKDRSAGDVRHDDVTGAGNGGMN